MILDSLHTWDILQFGQNLDVILETARGFIGQAHIEEFTVNGEVFYALYGRRFIIRPDKPVKNPPKRSVYF